MKALTVCQPYAHLILQGRKTCENREWFTKFRGALYIHAGKSLDWLDTGDPDDGDSRFAIPPGEMQFGAVIAIANLVACLHIESPLLAEWEGKMTKEQEQHINGTYCWILADVRPVKPVMWRGAQGLWDCAAVTESSSLNQGVQHE